MSSCSTTSRALLQAQRDAAWGEVARRLAHEIKNPLTPIQLSAERLRRRYLAQMARRTRKCSIARDAHDRPAGRGDEGDGRCVQGVCARAGARHARASTSNQLVLEVCELYECAELGLDAAAGARWTAARAGGDPGRMRQVLHNLVRTPWRRCTARPGGVIDVSTRRRDEEGQRMVELRSRTTAPAFPRDARTSIRALRDDASRRERASASPS